MGFDAGKAPSIVGCRVPPISQLDEATHKFRSGPLTHTKTKNGREVGRRLRREGIYSRTSYGKT